MHKYHAIPVAVLIVLCQTGSAKQARYVQEPGIVKASLYDLLCGLQIQLDVATLNGFDNAELDFYKSRANGGGYLIRAFPQMYGYDFQVETWGLGEPHISKFQIHLSYSKDNKMVDVLLEQMSSTYGKDYKKINPKLPIFTAPASEKLSAKAVLYMLCSHSHTI